MAILQSFNKRSKSWVKYSVCKGHRAKILNVKQGDKSKPFKGIPIKGAKKL